MLSSIWNRHTEACTNSLVLFPSLFILLQETNQRLHTISHYLYSSPPPQITINKSTVTVLFCKCWACWNWQTIKLQRLIKGLRNMKDCRVLFQITNSLRTENVPLIMHGHLSCHCGMSWRTYCLKTHVIIALLQCTSKYIPSGKLITPYPYGHSFVNWTFSSSGQW